MFTSKLITSFGSLYGKEGTEGMGYNETDEVKDTKKGEVEGKTPPLPKTNRDEKTTEKTVSGRFDMKTGKGYINNQEVSLDEYEKFASMSMAEKVSQYGQVKGNANNILATNNNIRDGVAQSASYEEGAEETVLIQEPDTSSDSKKEEVGETKTLIVNTGATEDTFESLYVR